MHKNLISILSKLELTDSIKTTKLILENYTKNGSSIVNFLYFANIVLNNLDSDEMTTKKEQYEKALLAWDFLLPDGIALQILYKKYHKKALPNLNGTDFLPFFLTHLPEDTPVEIIVYGGKEMIVPSSVKYITSTFWYPVIYAQNGYRDFDWSSVPKKKKGTIRILLVGRGSPLQEIWTEENRAKIEEMECMTFSVGGLIDFWSGTEEKRAPNWIRNIHGEWLYRAITNPKKNLKKTLVSLQLMKFLLQK